MGKLKPRVLLTVRRYPSTWGSLTDGLQNDDGPPSPDSPYVFGLWRHLTKDLGVSQLVETCGTAESHVVSRMGCKGCLTKFSEILDW
jgi:hypothetical protein